MFTSRASRQCIVIGPVSVFVGVFFYQGRTQEGLIGLKPPPRNAEHFKGLLMSERLCMSYEVPYDTLALVAETGQSQVYIRGNK